MKKYIFTENTEKTNEPLFDIKYCSRCCMPESEEGYNDDEYGMCRVCRSSEQKMHIDWVERRQMFKDISDRCKAQAGNGYDCMVPISGGKDSAFQLYVLTQIFNMIEMHIKILVYTSPHTEARKFWSMHFSF